MLEATLGVDAFVGQVELTFSVVNTGDEAVTLAFPDPRRAEFVVSDGDEEVWRWSHGRIFDQSTDEETLAPGEELTFEASWEDVDPGKYRVVAELAAADVDVDAAETVTVPSVE